MEPNSIQNSIQNLNIEQNVEISENRPRQSLKLEWNDVNYSLRLKRTRREMKDLDTNERYYDKHIISNASGVLCDREALFIMGPSGAGKSTFLNILSGRVSKPRNCKSEGNVTTNRDVTITKSNFGNYAAYVMQDYSLYPSFTCEQAIIFAARLKLNLSYKQAKEISDKIINSLSLDHCRQTLIGDIKIKGLSGGEKRRTSIAVELVSDPPILFLDEPTSGLDSFTSTKIVKLISDLAKNGKMIIATIHQPNSECFAMFDKLLLLVDGNTIYQGRAEDSVDYFNSIGYEVPEFCNPSDFFIKEFTIPYFKSEKDEIKVKNLVDSYQKFLKLNIEIETESVETLGSDNNLEKHKTKYRGSCLIKEFWILCLRSLYNIFFHPFFLKLKFILTLVNIVCLLSFYYDLKNDTEGIRNKECCLYLFSIIASVGPTTGIIMLIGSERAIFIREYSSKTYRLLPYVLSKLVVESPFEVLRTILHCVIPYYAIGFQQSFYNFFIFTISQMLTTIVFSSYGLALGNAFSNPSVAVSFAPLILLPSILFSGIICNLGTIYSWLSWMQYLSPLRYTMEILIRNEFEGVTPDEENPIDALHYNLGSTICFTILCCLTLVYILLCIVFLKLNVRHMQS